MTTLKWSDVYYKPVHLTISSNHLDGISIGNTPIDFHKSLNFEDRDDEIAMDALVKIAFEMQRVTSKSCYPQIAYYAFAITHRPSYMESYFPLIKSLSKESRREFHEIITKVMLHPGFDLKLLTIGSDLLVGHPNYDVTLPSHSVDMIRLMPELGYLVAGHIVELFFFRQDILDKLLEGMICIWLYVDQRSFAADGGVAGGCYSTQKNSVQLVLSRLFEGFSQPTPGVAPFFHEFGHLLDYFDAHAGKASLNSSGCLPGMRAWDGKIFTADARTAFLKGKRLEMERYERQVARPDGTVPLPIGHPYVFQNNSEFIAGYLEMFFRNPHYFAAQNPMLYSSFHMLLRQDPRDYWEADFPFYIQQNRAFYQSGQRPHAHSLTLDSA